MNLDLFVWWAVSISGGILFLILVSLYLYATSRRRFRESGNAQESKVRWGKDFVFVWILISLLIFYIVSVKIGSSVIFAAGNIIVESILIIYLVNSGRQKSEPKPSS